MADQSIKDLAYRTAASIFGGPVDLATMVMRPFGYRTPDTQVVGGSEWIGKKLEDVGLVSSARAPLSEFVASMAVPTPGGIAKGAAMALPAIGGMFIGKGAKTWDALSAAKAQELEKAGADARTIWLKTGTWKGPDGMWRQEISDAPAQITDDVYEGIKANQRFDGPMSKALEHRDLYGAYPDTGNIGSGFYAWRTPEGQYERATDTITAGGPGTTSQKSAALHEIQHALQQREGFASGGSPEMFVREGEGLVRSALQQKNTELNSYLNDLAKKAEAREISYTDLTKLASEKRQELDIPSLEQRLLEITNPYEAYRRLAGEAEARATQARMNLTQEQRRALFPEESYDVPINQLIIRRD